MFFLVGVHRIAYPGSLLIGALVMRNPLAIAWAITGYHLHELGPVDFAKIVVTALFVPSQFRIGQAKTGEFGLRRGRG